VIVGIRPEHFEDAAVEGDAPDRARFRATLDVVESMGSELYAYFDVKAEQMHTAELDELAADAGLEDLPSHGEGQQVVGRLSAGEPSSFN
jgi:multiple sugar transport system ATP-binding protein